MNKGSAEEELKPSEKRMYFRVYLETPLCCEITIAKINDKEIDTGITKICVNDIGPGGLLFTSNLNIPVNDNVIFEFYTKLLEEQIRVRGKIVRKTHWVSDLYRYGVCFDIDDKIREHYVKLFNELAVKLRNRIRIPKSSLCREKDIVKCLLDKK